jgi:hypothetical protein
MILNMKRDRMIFGTGFRAGVMVISGQPRHWNPS